MMRVTKRIVSFILILSMLLGLCMSVNAIENNNYAIEYKRVIEELINAYGISGLINEYECSNGVMHCELMDFDGNGMPELYVLIQRPTNNEYIPEYVHQIYGYSNGTACLILENSNEINKDLFDFAFYQMNGKIYLFEELSYPITNNMYPYCYSAYYTYRSIKEFNGAEFVTVWAMDNREAGAPTKNELISNGYTEEAGYAISYIENEFGNYYYTSNTSVTQNGEKRVIQRSAMDYECFYNELTMFLGKDNYSLDNDCIIDNGIRFVEYSTGGYSPVENLEYNVDTFLGQLSEQSFKLKADTINVVVNGEKVEFDQQPVIINGRTLVPMRAIFEKLGARVEWDDASQTAKASKDDICIEFKINSNILKKSNTEIELDVPAQLIGSRTMVPIRAISEAFGLKVDWDESTNTVIISSI